MKIAYLFGGPGVEKEVSVSGAESALPHFAADWQLLPVFIRPDSQWVVAPAFCSSDQAWQAAESLQSQSGLPTDIAIGSLVDRGVDVVWIGLHGEFGEDGQIQSLLESHSLAYTGSDPQSSSLAMDKPRVLQLLQDEGITTPDFLEVVSLEQATSFADHYGYPIFVLPADRGSSVGVTKAESESELESAIATANKISPRVMVSQYIEGREVSCGLLVTSKTDLVPLPVTELVPKANHRFFDYEAKYRPGECNEVTPADFLPDVTAHIQSVAKRVHQLVGADGYSRVDMIMKDNQPYVLEINTLPGMTPTSIIPQQAKSMGLTYSQFLAAICQAGLSRVPEVDEPID